MNSCEYSFGDTIVEVKDLQKSLSGKPILRDLSIDLKKVIRPGRPQGQVVSLLGPSGIGKTTLFRLLAGLDKPDSGSILAEGQIVHRGTVGVVAQNYPLLGHRTILGNMVVAGRQAGLSASDAATRGRELLTKFGLDEHTAKYPPQLSGGQRQRVAIAQQIICASNILLMDEPFSGLDLLAIQRVITIIDEVSQSDDRKTFVLVTHDVVAALQVSDTIWVLGRDRDPSGNPIPGARIVQTYNLMDRGLAWQTGITGTAEFIGLVQEIRTLFPTL
jgi:polar amino acid transport system ATP-binding protein/sulfate transport system ATP-binding protein